MPCGPDKIRSKGNLYSVAYPRTLRFENRERIPACCPFDRENESLAGSKVLVLQNCCTAWRMILDSHSARWILQIILLSESPKPKMTNLVHYQQLRHTWIAFTRVWHSLALGKNILRLQEDWYLPKYEYQSTRLFGRKWRMRTLCRKGHLLTVICQNQCIG